MPKTSIFVNCYYNYNILNVTKPIEMIDDQRSFGLIRYMFPNYNTRSLFDPNSKITYFRFKGLVNTQMELFVIKKI